MATAFVVHELQQRLPKVIQPEVHGLFDYAAAAAFLCAGAIFWKKNRAAALASFATSGLIVGQALMTDGPLVAGPGISPETHRRIDAALASASLVTPRLFGFSDTSAATLFRLHALVESAVIGLTDYAAISADPASLDLMPETAGGHA